MIRGKGRLSAVRGDHWERNGGNLNQKVLDELRDMRTLINNSRRGNRVQIAEAIEVAYKYPFTYEIMYEDIPEKCVLPTLPSIFSGSESAVQHLKQYTLSMMQCGRNDAVLCRYFPASLAGEALAWFDGLPKRSISSFKDLQRIFLSTYITNNMLRPGIETLFNLRRRPTESLQGLVMRWRTVCSELAGRVDEKNFILAFVNALIPTDLLYTQIFIIRNSLTMNGLREYQEEYIALEEKQRQVSKVARIPAKEGNSRLLLRIVHVVENDSKHEKGEPSRINRRSRMDRSTKDLKLPRLNTTVEKVWEAIVLTEEIPPPPNLGREPPLRTRSHDLCKYHCFHGNHTKDRRNIRRIILRLIEQGKLAHFLEGYVPPPPPLRDNEKIYRIEIDREHKR
ncbi:uncharacterized protein LOC113279652 [Papaver somniferum]|uniref:uncharacterized protein LOC113279652 n=1 Tax=Papaver somniferum TaxID=3469 RepID=UPI000E6F86C5|nr:uncharacterized protein LOC113279652 [Papaver somniferum]